MYRNEVIRSLLLWIDENLTEKLTINYVAKKSGYSKWHIQRIFKAVTGDTISRYVRNQRLAKAAKELCHGKRNITEIALEYQYDSCQSFSRAFYKEFNKSPMQYRKEQRLQGKNVVLQSDNKSTRGNIKRLNKKS